MVHAFFNVEYVVKYFDSQATRLTERSVEMTHLPNFSASFSTKSGKVLTRLASKQILIFK